jgi:hypothetical protein
MPEEIQEENGREYQQINSRMKSYIVWDVPPCIPVETNRCLEEHVACVVRVDE